MKTRIFASIIFTTALASSAAQAGTELSIEETYSGVLPSITRDDYGLGSYYVETKPQLACTQYDLNPLSIIYQSNVIARGIISFRNPRMSCVCETLRADKFARFAAHASSNVACKKGARPLSLAPLSCSPSVAGRANSRQIFTSACLHGRFQEHVYLQPRG